MDLHIDRLTLDLPALSEAEGRRLAALIAECLGSVDVPNGPAAAHRLSLSLAADPSDPLPILAGRIARQLLLALARS
jgi:hypothetical protein